MKRRNDPSTYKFNGAIATILLQFRHIFYLSCIKFLLKVCSNHGIIGLDYFILRHGHFAHGYYFGRYLPPEPKLALWFFFYYKF